MIKQEEQSCCSTHQINPVPENGDRNMKKRFSFTFYSNPSGILLSYTAKQRGKQLYNADCVI
jgi:hypothetical protein